MRDNERTAPSNQTLFYFCLFTGFSKQSVDRKYFARVLKRICHEICLICFLFAHFHFEFLCWESINQIYTIQKCPIFFAAFSVFDLHHSIGQRHQNTHTHTIAIRHARYLSANIKNSDRLVHQKPIKIFILIATRAISIKPECARNHISR